VLVDLITKKDKIEALKSRFNGVLIATVLPKSKKEVVALEHIKDAILEAIKEAEEFLKDSNNVPLGMFSIGYASILDTPLYEVTREIYEALTKPLQ